MNEKRVKITAPIDERHFVRLKKLAKQRGMSFDQLIEEAIKEDFRRHIKDSLLRAYYEAK